MADVSNIEGEDENILYDLLINTEWPPETDTQLRGNKEHNSSVIAKAVTGPFRFILHYLWYRGDPGIDGGGRLKISQEIRRKPSQ